jgi:hypothetical protein
MVEVLDWDFFDLVRRKERLAMLDRRGSGAEGRLELSPLELPASEVVLPLLKVFVTILQWGFQVVVRSQFLRTLEFTDVRVILAHEMTRGARVIRKREAIGNGNWKSNLPAFHL